MLMLELLIIAYMISLLDVNVKSLNKKLLIDNNEIVPFSNSFFNFFQTFFKKNPTFCFNLFQLFSTFS